MQLPGAFNVALVRQPDGVVVIEATTSGPYSAAVIAAAEKRFPGAKIKAVVTTSDAWPHVGGIREYVSAWDSDLRSRPQRADPDADRDGGAHVRAGYAHASAKGAHLQGRLGAHGDRPG